MDLKSQIIKLGYAKEIDWSDNLVPCESATDFFNEYIWVVLCAGMKEQVVRKIFDNIKNAIQKDKPISSAFKHVGKVSAIMKMAISYKDTFKKFRASNDKLSFLKTLPWIGEITKFHLAKNLGLDFVKPDRHLVRIATKNETNPFKMCKEISEATGDRLATVDVVIWRAANLGLV